MPKMLKTSEIAQMTPAYIEVTLCGGGCHNSRQSCVPVQSKVRTLMMILKIVMMPNLTARLCIVCNEEHDGETNGAKVTLMEVFFAE